MTANNPAVTAEGTAPRIVRLPERRHSHFNVRPRYTAGSPAAVDRAIAERQAESEIRGHETVLTGAWGKDHQARAQAEGLGPLPGGNDGQLHSPVEYVEEHSNHWLVQCLCTGVLFVRQFHNAKPSRAVCKRCVAAHEHIAARRIQ